MSARRSPQSAPEALGGASNGKFADSVSYTLLNALIRAFGSLPKEMPDVASLDTSDPKQLAIAVLADIHQLSEARQECITRAEAAIAKVEGVKNESLARVDEKIAKRTAQLFALAERPNGEKHDG